MDDGTVEAMVARVRDQIAGWHGLIMLGDPQAADDLAVRFLGELEAQQPRVLVEAIVYLLNNEGFYRARDMVRAAGNWADVDGVR